MLYAPLLYNADTGVPILDMEGEHARQAMPDEPTDPGPGPEYDENNPGLNPGIRDTWERENMFHTEDQYMNRALCNMFLSMLSPEI